LVEVGLANDIDVAERWGHLNVGMQRMNLGNCLRGRANKGLGVVIGDFVVEAIEVDDEKPAKKAKAPAKKAPAKKPAAKKAPAKKAPAKKAPAKKAPAKKAGAKKSVKL
jgi:hypothetical protein